MIATEATIYSCFVLTYYVPIELMSSSVRISIMPPLKNNKKANNKEHNCLNLFPLLHQNL